MYICNAYVHEPASYENPVYVREMSRSTGANRYDNTIDEIMRNLWSGKPAGHDYTKAFFMHLGKHGFHRTDGEPYPFYSAQSDRPILVAITGDDFLVAVAKQ